MKLSFILILILLFTACKNESVGLLQESSITHASVTKMQIQRNLTVLNGKVSVELWKE